MADQIPAPFSQRYAVAQSLVFTFYVFVFGWWQTMRECSLSLVEDEEVKLCEIVMNNYLVSSCVLFKIL